MKRKKLLSLLVLLTIANYSLQDDYEEEVFLNKCALETTKITDFMKAINLELKECSKSNGDLGTRLNQVEAKMKTDFNTAKDERADLKALVVVEIQSLRGVFEEMKKWIAEEMSAVKKQVIDAAEKNSYCGQWKTRLGDLELKNLSTGAYHYSMIRRNHSNAAKFCETQGMRLAQFETHYEMRVVMANAKPGEWFWVGATGGGKNNGEFRWSDGRKVDDNFWYGSQPSEHNAGKEGCAHFSTVFMNLLVDAKCNATWPSVCELNREFIQCL